MKTYTKEDVFNIVNAIVYSSESDDDVLEIVTFLFLNLSNNKTHVQIAHELAEALVEDIAEMQLMVN